MPTREEIQAQIVAANQATAAFIMPLLDEAEAILGAPQTEQLRASVTALKDKCLDGDLQKMLGNVLAVLDAMPQFIVNERERLKGYLPTA